MNDHDLNTLFERNSDLYSEVFQRCGITQVLKVITINISIIIVWYAPIDVK